MEALNVLQKGYKMALQYEENILSWNLGRIDEIYPRAKKSGTNPVRYGISPTMRDLSWAVNGSEKIVSGTNVVVDLVDMFRESKMWIFMGLVHEIAN